MSISGQPSGAVGDEVALDLHARAMLIRAVERRLLDLFAEGKPFVAIHACIGQESAALRRMVGGGSRRLLQALSLSRIGATAVALAVMLDPLPILAPAFVTPHSPPPSPPVRRGGLPAWLMRPTPAVSAFAPDRTHSRG